MIHMIYSNPHLEPILEYNANVYELSNREINFKINFWPQKGGHDYRGKVFIHSKKEFAEIEINDDPKNSNNFVIKKLSGRNDEWNITLCARWLMIGAYKEIRDFSLILDFFQKIYNLCLYRHIESRNRLVAHDELGV